MAHLQPSAFPASGSCDFCKTALATILVNGRLTCERHKNSEIVEVRPSATSGGGSSSSSSSSRGNRNKDYSNVVDVDDDVLEVWEPPPPPPPPATAIVSPSTPPSKPTVVRKGVLDRGSSSDSSSGSSSIIPGALRADPQAGSQKRRVPLVPASPWGSPAAPLPLSDDDDDDVRFAGTSLSSGGVEDFSGTSTQALGMVSLGLGGSSSGVGNSSSGGVSSSSGGGGGSSGPRRARRRSLPPPAGAGIFDLATLPWFLDPPPARGESTNPGGAGIGSGGGGGYDGGAKGKDQTGVVRFDESVGTTAAGASAATAKEDAGGASSSMAAAALAAVQRKNAAPSATKAGKVRPTKKQRKLKPDAPCIVCFEDSALDKCARCPEGHAMCQQCVTSYVTETLMPQGTIFWDTIKCGGSSSCGNLFGPSVTALLPRLVIRKIETKQMDVAHLVAGERDPTSDKWISKHSKDCPNCGVPIQRSSGCMHMTCAVCRHNFWYNCTCSLDLTPE
eukprot:g12666.t1